MESNFTQRGRTGWRRALIIACAALLPCFIACMFYSEWGPSVGFAGLMGRLAFAAGFALFGVSMAFFLAVVIAETVAPAGLRILRGSHGGAAGRAAKAPALSEMKRRAPSAPRSNAFSQRANEAVNAAGDTRRAANRAVLGREVAALVLNLLIYGGGAILALGAFSSLDRANSFAHVALVILVCAACVAAIVLWRRHRVKSCFRFTALSNVGVLLLFAALALVGLVPGLIVGSQVAYDLVAGSRSEVCTLVELDEYHPTGRLAGFRQDTYSFAFATQNGEEVRVHVAEADKAALAGLDEGDEVHLTYYPHSGVLVSAGME